MKSTLFAMGTILIMLPQSLIFAEESRATNPPPPPQNTATPPVRSSETKNTDAKYWEDQKVQMQAKSTEMRKVKYAELVAKGVDVSLLTPDILDAAKTEESKFWEILKGIQQTGEIKSRKEYLAKIALQGTDISGFTDAIIADGNLFWDMARKLQSTTPPPKGVDKTIPLPKTDSGMIGKNQEQELATRKHIIEELRSKGIDTSGFTDAVMADAAAFWKLAQSINTAGIKNTSPAPRDPRKEGGDTLSGSLAKEPPREHTTPNLDKNSQNQDQKITPPGSFTPKDGGLTPKARELFQARLDKIPSEKKSIILTRLEEIIQKQIDTATAKGTQKIIMKLQDMLSIVHAEQGSTDDTALIDSIITAN